MNWTIRLVWVLVLWLVWVACAGAQINIERLRGTDWPSGFSGTLGLDFSFRSGNVDIWEFGVDGRMGYGWPRVQTFLLGNGELGWKSGSRFSNAGLAHWRTIYRLQDRVRPEGFLQVNYDRARRLDFRALWGGGMRLGAVYSESVKVWWGTAYMLEHERLDLSAADRHPARVWHHRWSNYLSVGAQVNERVGLGGVVYVQPRFDAVDDYRLLGDFKLGVEVSDRIDLVVTWNLRYDSAPPVGVEKRDMKVKTGISVQF